MQDRGELPKDAEFMPGNSEHTLADGSSPENTVTLIEDKELPLDYQLVEIWNVLLYCQIGDRKGWWSIMFAEDTSQVLKCEPYEYSLPWYAIYRIHLEPSRFWPEVPVANNLQSLQHMHSTLSAILEQGGIASAVGMLIINGVLTNGQKLTSIKPGAVVNLTQTGAGVGSQAIFPAINVQSIPGILAKIEQDADAAVAIGRIATNQELNDATATEVQALQASQAQAENAYAAIAAAGLEQVFAVVAGYWRDSYDTMQSVYGNRVDLDELVQVAGMDVEWKAAGRAPDATPQAQMQKLQALYQLAQNPMSVLDSMKVEERIVREMGLGDIDELLKEKQDDYAGSAGMVDPAGAQGVPGMAQGPQAGAIGPVVEDGPPAF
jgi:hypothetical protein